VERGCLPAKLASIWRFCGLLGWLRVAVGLLIGFDLVERVGEGIGGRSCGHLLATDRAGRRTSGAGLGWGWDAGRGGWGLGNGFVLGVFVDRFAGLGGGGGFLEIASSSPLGLETAEGVEAAVEIALGGIDAALGAGKGSDVVREDFAVGHFVMGDGLHAFAFACPGFGFNFTQTALQPGMVDDGVDENCLSDGGGLVFVVEGGGERCQGIRVFAADDFGLGFDGGFQGVGAEGRDL
jgi:hypothetical protein